MLPLCGIDNESSNEILRIPSSFSWDLEDRNIENGFLLRSDDLHEYKVETFSKQLINEISRFLGRWCEGEAHCILIHYPAIDDWIWSSASPLV